MRWIGILAAVLLLAGCATDGVAEKSGSDELRTDVAPITDRFPDLDPVSVQWRSGTLGSDSAPGPSTYWIDAVIELDDEDFAAYVDAHDLDATAAPEDFRAPLPTGDLQRADTLDEQFSVGEFHSAVYLEAESRSLVLSTVFP